jgi:hypothetical protein
MNRWVVPGVPFLLSLFLSLITVGTHPYWQDSALYLMAVKELGVLYPPGFGLYLVLCKTWTLILFFLDFTLAVHLFSSLCAALTAGTTAVAVRDLLRSRGKTFRVFDEDPGELAETAAVVAGVVLACGFTFWSTAIYAKGYALYYFVLSLLIWRMIRADESGRGRDFTIVAALIGLAWQCHPSAALTGAALVAFTAVHAKSLGVRGVLGRGLVAAATAIGPSLILLPLLMSRDPWLRMGHAHGFGELLQYVSGRQFTHLSGVFGLDGARAASFGRYLWQEMLGIGLLLVAIGFVTLATSNRRLLAGILLWMVPYAGVTILFKIEGQHDCWFVASWLPLSLAAGVGAVRIGRKYDPQGKIVLAILGVAAAGWSIAVNYSDLSQRRYELAELYGRTILSPVDADAIVVLSGDDPNALSGYLQRVKGERSDVVLVTASFLRSDWYYESLLRRHPFLRKPVLEAAPGRDAKEASVGAFLRANADLGRPMLTDRPLPPDLLPSNRTLAPAGVLWKLIPDTGAIPIDPKYWKFPVEPEQVVPRIRRERGQSVTDTPDGVVVKPQAYERRLLSMLLLARFNLAMARNERREIEAAGRLLESVVAIDPDYRENPNVAHVLGSWYLAQGQTERAQPFLRRSAEAGYRPDWRATDLSYLGLIARKKGDAAEAQRLFRAAMSVPGLSDAQRADLERQLRSP